MLVDITAVLADAVPVVDAMRVRILARSQRYAAVQERLISPEDSYPAIGRSLVYRFGAFQTLAQMVLPHRRYER